MGQKTTVRTILTSILAGFSIAFAVSTTLYHSDLTSAAAWVLTLALLTFGFGAVYFLSLPYASEQFGSVPTIVKIWGTVLIVASAMAFSFKLNLPTLIAFLFAGFLLIAPGLTSLNEFLIKKRAVRFIMAWTFGGLVSLLGVGFFKNFHPSSWEFLLFTFTLNSFFIILFDLIFEHLAATFQNNSIEKVISLLVLAVGLLLFFLTLRLLAHYPTLFSFDLILPEASTIPAFLGLTILSQSWTALLLTKLDKTGWRESPFVTWMKRNLPGLLLASTITASTYLLANVLVSSNLALADNYFDTDSPIWVNFLTAQTNQIGGMRAVHPYALMILRPPVWLLSLLLNGDKFHAAILLNAIFGGVCAYLVWVFFKQRTNHTAYALIIAALLGFSNSHLLLSAFLESYIFSAAALIATVALLQNKDIKLRAIVPLGLVTFGITITNFIQSGILFLLTQRNVKKALKYALIVTAFAVVLAFVQNAIQPNNQPFYITSNLGNESAFEHDLINVPFSQTISRANVISRTMTLFSVVAPRPMVLMEEIGCTYPCFNTIRFFRGKYQYASYIGVGSLLARSWFILLVIAALIFAWNLFKSPKESALQAALLLNILFNFILHMNYGDDPMLYSPNWTYAIVLFFGISFEQLGRKKWFNILLLVFLSALIFNNLELFRTVLDAILPFGRQ